MRVSHKIFSGYAVMLVVIVFSSLFSIFSFNRVEGVFNQMVQAEKELEGSAHITKEFLRVNDLISLYILSGEETYKKSIASIFKDLAKDIDEEIEIAAGQPKQKAVIQEMKKLEKKYEAAFKTISEKMTQRTVLTDRDIDTLGQNISDKLAKVMDQSSLGGDPDVAVAAATVRAHFLNAIVAAKNFAATNQSKFDIEVTNAMSSFYEDGDILEAYMIDDALIAMYGEARKESEKFQEAYVKTKKLTKEIRQLNGEVLNGLEKQVNKKIEQIDSMSIARAQAAQASVGKGVKTANNMQWAALAVGALMALGLTFIGTRTINSAISNLERKFNKTTETITHIGSICKELASNMTSVSTNVAETSRQSSEIAGQANTMTTNITEVSAAVEQMDGSIQEIARTADESRQLVETTSRNAQSTFTVVENLSHSSTKIGEVVGIINELADQTNLLALNASIEAARAGDAGRGFAVVADEVKKLATETTNATDHINEQVKNIQDVSREAVSSIQEILTGINEVETNVASIDASISEQQNASGNISQNMQEASHFTQGVGSNISQINAAAETSGQLSTEALREAEEMSQQVDELVGEADRFLSDLKQF